MAAEVPPVRITKQRAQAFLDAAGRGLDEMMTDLEDQYGVTFHLDGTATFEEGKFDLLDESEKRHIDEQIDKLTRVVDTLAIFRRRYG